MTAADGLLQHSAHSRPLNANQKAYAAWALWTEIAASMMPGADFDQDGDVDHADFVAWQAGFDMPASAHEDGDTDADGDVDGTNFLTWQRQFGSTSSSGTGASNLLAVPESTTLALVAMLALYLASWRRKNGGG